VNSLPVLGLRKVAGVNFWVKLVLAPFLCTFAPWFFLLGLIWVRVLNKRLPDFFMLE
jgi:hypothetical protein